MTSTPRRVVIVGGGITGLAAAHALERARAGGAAVAYTVLEATGSLGGIIRTERAGGYLIEGGPDGFVANKPAAAALCRAVGLGDALVQTVERNRRVYVVHRGALHPLPEGLALAAPTRLGPMVATPILSLRAKLRMALDLVLPVRTDGVDESMAEFFTRRLGAEALEVLAEPLLAGIYVGDPRLLSMAATFPQLVAQEREHGGLIRAALRARRARRDAPEQRMPSAFLSLAGGMGTLIDAVAASLAPDAVRTNTRVVGLTRGGDGAPWRVALEGGGEVPADVVLLALPTFAVARLLEPHDPEAAGLLAEVTYASTAAATLGWPRDQVRHPLDATGFLVPRRAGFEITASTWPSAKWPGRSPVDRALFRVFLGGAHDPALYDRDDAALIELATRELSALLGITTRPELARLTRYSRKSPQPALGHRVRMQRVRARLAQLPGLHAAGGGYDGVGIPDCVTQGQALAARALGAGTAQR